MTPALLPHLAIKREAYQKGLASGRRSKYYDEEARVGARDRFLAKYGDLGQALRESWEEGWRDADIYRREWRVSWMEFIVAVSGALAWPLGFFIVILVMRREFRK